MQSPSAQKEAQAIQKKHGTSYYLATAFFPKKLRQATYALYAFVRIPDQIVDEPEEGSDPKKVLEAWIAKWQGAMDGKPTDDSLIALATQVFKEFEVPREYGEDFLAAMLQDTEKDRYASYAELEQYMYRSAAVVGLMMTHIIGVVPQADQEKVRQSAVFLGNAMQLTNFLRDIDEDYLERKRIYLPQDEMQRFGISDRTIIEREMNEKLERFMRFQVERAENLFKEAEKGITLLNPQGRRAVRLAAKLYAAILPAIAKQGYNPFAGRARTTRIDKLRIILKHYWR